METESFFWSSLSDRRASVIFCFRFPLLPSLAVTRAKIYEWKYKLDFSVSTTRHAVYGRVVARERIDFQHTYSLVEVRISADGWVLKNMKALTRSFFPFFSILSCQIDMTCRSGQEIHLRVWWLNNDGVWKLENPLRYIHFRWCNIAA